VHFQFLLDFSQPFGSCHVTVYPIFSGQKGFIPAISLPNVTVPVKNALPSASLFLTDKTALLNKYHFFIISFRSGAILGCSTRFSLFLV